MILMIYPPPDFVKRLSKVARTLHRPRFIRVTAMTGHGRDPDSSGQAVCATTRRASSAGLRRALLGTTTAIATPQPKSWSSSRPKRPDIQLCCAANSDRFNWLVRRRATGKPRAPKWGSWPRSGLLALNSFWIGCRSDGSVRVAQSNSSFEKSGLGTLIRIPGAISISSGNSV